MGSALDWRPIITAPRDGAPFWGFLYESGIRLLRWATPEECAAYENSDEPGEYDGCFVEVADFDDDWTPHWWVPMDELPIPPGAELKGLAGLLDRLSSAKPAEGDSSRDTDQ